MGVEPLPWLRPVRTRTGIACVSSDYYALSEGASKRLFWQYSGILSKRGWSEWVLLYGYPLPTAHEEIMATLTREVHDYVIRVEPLLVRMSRNDSMISAVLKAESMSRPRWQYLVGVHADTPLLDWHDEQTP